MTDFGYGGQLTPSPVTFPVGQYAYDEDAQTATITPFQNLRTDFASLLAIAAQLVPQQPVPGKGKVNPGGPIKRAPLPKAKTFPQ
jgi:hypothetical protein